MARDKNKRMEKFLLRDARRLSLLARYEEDCKNRCNRCGKKGNHRCLNKKEIRDGVKMESIFDEVKERRV